MPYLAESINKNGLKGSPLPACPAPVATRTWATKSQRATSCPAPAGKKHLLDEDAEDGVVVDDANGEKVVTLREQPKGEVPPPPKAPAEFQRPPKEASTRAFLIEEAKSLDHMMDHSKFNSYCRCCMEARAQRKAKRKGGLNDQDTIPAEWEVAVTGDHLFQTKEHCDEGTYYIGDDEIRCAKTAVVPYDLGTRDLTCFQATKSAEHTIQALQDFAGEHAVKPFYNDNAPELSLAAFQLGWMHPTFTPGVPQTNGLAERMVRSAKEGGRANLVQAGLSVEWFEFAAPDFCFTKSTEVTPEGGADTPYFLKHEKESKHIRVPFGALVDFMPVPNPNDAQGAFESKTRPGLRVG